MIKKLILLVSSLLIVAVMINSGFGVGEATWNCTPIDPLHQTVAENACFRAVLREENRITLEWVTTNSSPLVYVYDDIAPQYKDPGIKAARCRSGPENGCAVSFRVTTGGLYRWKLMVEDPAKNIRTHVMTELIVTPPYSPDVAGGGFVDMLAPSGQKISWKADSRNGSLESGVERAWIELKHPEELYWKENRYSRSAIGFDVPETALGEPGDFVYRVRDCHLPSGSQFKFCSDKRAVGFYVGHDHFRGWNNRYVSSGEDVEIKFTTDSGDMRILHSESLLPSAGFPAIFTRDSSYTISKERLTPGAHKIHLVSCSTSLANCTNRAAIDRVRFAGIIEQEVPGFYLEGDIIARITPLDESLPQLIRMPMNGLVYFIEDQSTRRVEPDESIAYVTTKYKDTLNIVVDSAVEWEMDRDYREDFTSAVGYDVAGVGQALDVSYGPHDGIWLTREFSNSIEHVSSEGELSSISLPLARTAIPGTGKFRAVQPFSIWMSKIGSGATTISSLAERVTPVAGKIWFTQGGGMREKGRLSGKNHSRVISFDPSLIDLPSTEYDDRLCVYNMPTDDPEGYGDNEVIGLTGTHDRIWVAESRGLLHSTTSSISSFVPHPRQCVNTLDFNDPAALMSQDLQYCNESQTPEQDACIEKIELDVLTTPIKVAHLEADPFDQSIWFSDASGQCLGNLNPDKAVTVSIHKFDNPHEKPFDGFPGFGGLPWSLQADQNAVYTAEYATRHILRFDKNTATFDEIAIPFKNAQVRLHSLALDSSSDRLWFTLSNEIEVPFDKKSSTIGYIDLESWRAHLAAPGRHEKISAVIYAGLDTIPTPINRSGMHHSFRGVSINPRSGKLALGSAFREQIIELTPVSGFWPLTSNTIR